MPEYLSPGVYVEEVPSGNKPIEGVSTSTAGFVGVTERGPVNEPTLVTSYADFTRKFGAYLDPRIFTGNRDVLPYAVEGFFTNGGTRAYITRVVGDDARYSAVDLYGVPRTDSASTTLAQRVAAEGDTLLLNSGTNIANTDVLLLQDGTRSEYVTATSDPIDTGVRLRGSLHHNQPDGRPVVAQSVTPGAALTVVGDMSAGGGLQLDAGDVATLAAGDVLRVQDTAEPAHTEFVTIATAATVALVEPGLLFDHPQATTEVHPVTMADAAGGSTALDGAASPGDFVLQLAATAGLAADQVVAIGTGATLEYQVVRNVVSALSITTTVTEFIHAAGTAVIKQVPLLRVHARHPGQWGNSLRVRIAQTSVLETTVGANAGAGDAVVELGAIFGLSAGSVLDVKRGAAGTPILRQRLTGVDPATNEVELAGGVGAALLEDDTAMSVEFDLIVERLNEEGKVVEGEAFSALGVDPYHANYALKLVGAFDRAAGEPEETGTSDLIRISDLTRSDAGVDVTGAAALRLSIPYDGVARTLSGGSDDLAHIDDATYIGASAVDPEDRTGIYTLENIDDISIVAVPGRTAQDVQNTLINHCTRMRYRFAVLDAEAGAKLKDVQNQRQNYDTTYGALYYPWMVIGNPFGRNGDVRYIPNSGHVVGIYARSDTQRGVHKAPANEVILGIRDLQVRLTKGEQDILNPKHINCLRDFRDLNRGLRVWGARTLSSDPEWKYVNVRRLLLFIEKSIERGMQWAVFEPNAESLWATVKRSITNFLVSVWRDGALEGTKQEEAFFVDVGLTTMTQSDIDNGRLIVRVGVAPVKPAEFVIIRISQKTREATS
jgi:phage tail sheath protein FI